MSTHVAEDTETSSAALDRADKGWMQDDVNNTISSGVAPLTLFSGMAIQVYLRTPLLSTIAFRETKPRGYLETAGAVKTFPTIAAFILGSSGCAACSLRWVYLSHMVSGTRRQRVRGPGVAVPGYGCLLLILRPIALIWNTGRYRPRLSKISRALSSVKSKIWNRLGRGISSHGSAVVSGVTWPP